MAFIGLAALGAAVADGAGQRSPVGLGESDVADASARLRTMSVGPITTREMAVCGVSFGRGKATIAGENAVVISEVPGRKSLGRETSRAPCATSCVSVLAAVVSPCRC